MTLKTLVVVIPAYNEEATIEEVIRSIPRDCMDNVKVVVVDDGSSDSTRQSAKNANADLVVSFLVNRGLGVAFSRGIDEALRLGADIIVNIDADMQFNPRDIPQLINPILDGAADFTVCSRFLDKNLEPDMPYIKKIGNRIFSSLISFLTRQRLTDTQCGFRAYTREAALHLNVSSQYTYTQESIIDLIENGMHIVEIPLKVKGQRNGKSKIVDNVVSYALRSLLILTRTIRDHWALHFFGGISLSVLSIGFGLGAFMVLHWIVVGKTSPYQSLISASILFNTVGFILLVLALQADMQSKQKKAIDKLFYQYHEQNLLTSDGKDDTH